MPEIRRPAGDTARSGAAGAGRSPDREGRADRQRIGERSPMARNSLRNAIKGEREAYWQFDSAVRDPATAPEQILELKAAWSLAQEQIEFVKSDLIIQRANKLSLPLPETHDDTAWMEMGDSYGIRYLTRLGQSQLRRAVREEEKVAREPILTVGSMTAGILGVATGLTSLVLRLMGV